MKRPVVIGIAGGSGSGKTTVQRRILETFGADHIALLDHDAYYRDLQDLPYDIRAQYNFDHPNALETELMIQHLDELLAGRPIEKPVYDFTQHRRTTDTIPVVPRAVIIVDGILILAEPDLRKRMDIKVFVDAPDDVRLIRRIRRDLHERGRDIDGILNQYEHTVGPMHWEFVEPSKRYADLMILRGGHNEVALEMMLARIRALLP